MSKSYISRQNIRNILSSLHYSDKWLQFWGEHEELDKQDYIKQSLPCTQKLGVPLYFLNTVGNPRYLYTTCDCSVPFIILHLPIMPSYYAFCAE